MSDKQSESFSQSEPRPVPSGGNLEDISRSPSQNSTSRAASIIRRGSPLPGSPSIRQVPIPSQLATGDSPQDGTPLAGLEGSKGSVPITGESALAKALRDYSGRNSPPRFGTPPIRSDSPASTAAAGRGPRTNYGSFGQRSGTSPEREPYENYDIVRKHLVTGLPNTTSSISAGLSKTGSPSPSTAPSGNRATADDEFSSLQLQGGDIHRQIYRLTEQQDAESSGQGRTRSRSFHATERPRPEHDIPIISNIKQPGGFRRNYLTRGAVSPSPGPSNRAKGPNGEPMISRPQPFTSNFIEFLSLYGHFAGEELGEDDEVLGPDEYFSSDAYDGAGEEESEDEREPGEGSALLTPGRKRRRRKEAKAGDTSPSGAALLLLKSFVGTGVLFLPKAFLNGGMMFSTLLLLAVSLLSYNCFVLLVKTRLVVEQSFGEMGKIIYGNWMRNLINLSLVISQIGFTSAYIVFVSENLQGFIQAVSNCRTSWDIKYLILLQMIVFLPVSLYRNISRIQVMALVADVFIVLGLVYLYYYDIFTLVSQHGVSDIALFNPNDWTLFIGTAIFTFEGIGLIIPIQTAMREPKKFPSVLAAVMVGITVVFVSMGALSYAAFGSKTKTVVILNMPQDNKFVNGVQFIYSLAILLSTPLQIFPAIEISSQQLFSKTGKYNPYIKWKKNIFRFFMVFLCAAVAWVGANDLDKFVALVGSFACIPLVYIYPPMLHYRAVASTSFQRGWDILLCVGGIVAMAYTSILTVSSWVNGPNTKLPGYCDN